MNALDYAIRLCYNCSFLFFFVKIYAKIFVVCQNTVWKYHMEILYGNIVWKYHMEILYGNTVKE